MLPSPVSNSISASESEPPKSQEWLYWTLGSRQADMSSKAGSNGQRIGGFIAERIIRTQPPLGCHPTSGVRMPLVPSGNKANAQATNHCCGLIWKWAQRAVDNSSTVYGFARKADLLTKRAFIPSV